MRADEADLEDRMLRDSVDRADTVHDAERVRLAVTLRLMDGEPVLLLEVLDVTDGDVDAVDEPLLLVDADADELCDSAGDGEALVDTDTDAEVLFDTLTVPDPVEVLEDVALRVGEPVEEGDLELDSVALGDEVEETEVVEHAELV